MERCLVTPAYARRPLGSHKRVEAVVIVLRLDRLTNGQRQHVEVLESLLGVNRDTDGGVESKESLLDAIATIDGALAGAQLRSGEVTSMELLNDQQRSTSLAVAKQYPSSVAERDGRLDEQSVA